MVLWNGDNKYSFWIFTPDEFSKLPDGVELTSITGKKVIKGKDYIDMGTLGGYIAYGLYDPVNHPLRELFTVFRLS